MRLSSASPVASRARVSLRASRPAGRQAVCTATTTREKKPAVDVGASLSLLRAACDDTSLPTASLCAALRAVEVAKPSQAPEDLAKQLRGVGSKAQRWRLVFTTSSKDLERLRKTGTGGGGFFPVTAVQSWDTVANTITNGVYLGWLAALQFDGPIRLKGWRLTFDFTKLSIKVLGLVLRFNLKPASYSLPPDGTKEAQKLPFFLMAHADDSLVIARGRSGGLAYWCTTTPSWELEKGALKL